MELACLPETFQALVPQIFMTLSPNPGKIRIAFIWKIMTGSNHNFAHTITAELTYFIMLIANITGVLMSMATPFKLQI